MKLWLAFLLATAASPQAEPPLATITGVVRDSLTGYAVSGSTVSLLLSTGAPFATKTDSQGRYSLKDAPSGTYQVTAVGNSAPEAGPAAQHTRTVSIPATGVVPGIDFRLPGQASLSGKVIDAERHPLAGVSIYLFERRYSGASIVYFQMALTRTNNAGEYRIADLPANRPMLLAMVRLINGPPRKPKPGADSLEPKLSPATTFYPRTTRPEDAEEISLSPGETREKVDIRAVDLPEFCVDGVMDQTTGPVKMVTVSPQSTGPALTSLLPNPKSADDLSFQVCGVHPGRYIFNFSPRSPKLEGRFVVGSTTVTVSDRNIHDLKILFEPAVTVPWEMAWDGDASVQQPAAEATLQFRGAGGHGSPSTKVVLPGRGVITNLEPDDYTLKLTGLPRGANVKELAYAGQQSSTDPLRLGDGGLGAALRITVARDGASLSIAVRDKDAKPVSEAAVALFRANVSNEADLAARVLLGQSDQSGAWSSGTIAPGKYLALATSQSLDLSVASIARLWTARSRATEIEIGPFGSAQVNLEPRELR